MMVDNKKEDATAPQEALSINAIQSTYLNRC